MNQALGMDDACAIMATTGKAATVINGSTIHSPRDGVALPVGTDVYTPLSGKRLQHLQEKFKNTRLIVCDEFSMLRRKELYWLDLRLKEIKCSNLPFGGISILFVGDTGQLPPVQAKPLWTPGGSKDSVPDAMGYNFYNGFFVTVVQLTEVLRLDPNDDEAVWFRQFLGRLRGGELQVEDWKKFVKNCSRDSMTSKEWKERGFEDNDVVHLYCTNKEVDAFNAKKLMELGNPIAMIKAKHTGRAREHGPDRYRMLESEMFLAVGAKVYLTQNIAAKFGLANGSVGIVKDIVYEEGTSAPNLPKYVWVDFGTNYKGPTFFPHHEDPNFPLECNERAGWVPIAPLQASSYSFNKVRKDYEEHTRTMLPLRLCYAWTVWKSQGQTFRCKVVVNLTSKEAKHGLTYVACSRVQRLSDIGILGGLTQERLLVQTRTHQKVGPRLKEESRLQGLIQKTLDQWDKERDEREQYYREQQFFQY